jgi:hypothetical protein
MKRFVLASLLLSAPLAAEIRLGIIGTDTSHAPAFTRILNDPNHADHVPGARVVAAYKGGSPDVESSHTRVDKFAEELRTKWNIELVDDIATLCSKVDGILLESVDGRVHLAQAREVIKAKKPMFIDKPLASTLEDAREIARLAKQAGVPWFSTSSLRYSTALEGMKHPDAISAITWGPGPTEKTHYLDLSWYAIHPIEMLFTLMGTGVEEVTRVSTKDSDMVVGRWKDGRLGTVHAIRPSSEYGAIVVRPKQVLRTPTKGGAAYSTMLRDVVKFFETGVPPVANEETLELFAFMDAAQRSKESGGKPTRLR